MKKNFTIKHHKAGEYPEILDAIHNGRLVLFIGAGLSRLAGYAGWDEYANKKVDWLIKNVSILGNEDRIDLLKSKFKKLGTKEKLTLCKYLLDGSKVDYNDNEMRRNEISFLKMSDTSINKERVIYGYIRDINAKYVTTNYDECIETALQNKPLHAVSVIGDSLNNDAEKCKNVRVYYKQDDFTKGKFYTDDTAVFHIHGSVKDVSSMIETTQDYVTQYSLNSKLVREFLPVLFSEFTVLFIGYGLQEFEILEYIIARSGIKEGQIGDRQHYALFATNSEDEISYKLQEKYYESLNIKLIPYYTDKNGYEELINVLREWSKDLSSSSRAILFSDKVEELDKILKSTSTNDRLDEADVDCILEIISQSQDRYYLNNSFWNKNNDLKWLEPIYQKKLFLPPYNFKPVFNNKTVTFNAMTAEFAYLSRIISKADCNQKKLILEIIKSIHQKCEIERAFDNYLLGRNIIIALSECNIPPAELNIIFLKRYIMPWLFTKYDDHQVLSVFLNDIVLGWINNDEYNEPLGFVLLYVISNANNLGKSIMQGYTLDDFINKVIEKTSTFKKLFDALYRTICRSLAYNEHERIIQIEDKNHILKARALPSGSYNIYFDGKKLFNFKSVNTNFDIFINQLNDNKIQVAEKENDYLWQFYCQLYGETTSYSIRDSVKPYNYYYFKNDFLVGWIVKIIDNAIYDEKVSFINELLQSNYFLCKRIAMYFIGKIHSKELLMAYFSELDKNKISFQYYGFALELNEILNNISPKMKKKTYFRTLINKYVPPIYDRMDLKQEWQLARLKALKTIFQTDLEKFIKKNGDSGATLTSEVPSFQVETSPLQYYSPYTLEQIQTMPIEELVTKIMKFKSSDILGSFDGKATDTGFSNIIEQAVLQNPQKYVNKIYTFADTKYIYLSKIFYALKRYLNEENCLSINVQSLLSGVERLANGDNFWNHNEQNTSGRDSFFVYKLADVIKNIVYLFEDLLGKKLIGGNDLPVFGRTLRTLLSKYIIYYTSDKDFISIDDYINNAMGVLVGLTINYNAVLKSNKTSKKICDDEFNFFSSQWDILINRKLPIIFAAFGYELMNLYYLNEYYARRSITIIKDSDEKLLNTFFDCYLGRQATRYTKVLQDLGSIYAKYLTKDFKGIFPDEKYLRKTFVWDICIINLYNFEDKSSSMLEEILAKGDFDDIKDAINYFAVPKDKIDRQKLIHIWKLIVKAAKAQKLEEKREEILAESVMLSSNFKFFDSDVYELLKIGAKYSGKYFTAIDLLEQIHRFIKNDEQINLEDAKNLAKIFRDMFNNREHLLYSRDEEILDIVKWFKKWRDEEIDNCIDTVKENFARQGKDFIKDLLKKLSKKK